MSEAKASPSPRQFATVLIGVALTGVGLLACLPIRGDQGEPTSAAAILQELRSFRELGTVLHVAAHPDDENTQLITYLARGRGCRVAYLSVTRGDGGQNVIGPEFDEQLGVIRTQELLAARRLDGGQQFFTRAKDFGFSKDYMETLTKWDRQQVIADIVRVIRYYRPDVIVTRFSPQPGGTHGHHTASAVLSLEAFKLAGDPKEFPEQLSELTVWQPKRIVYNGGKGGGGKGDGMRLDVGGTDPVLGKSFGEISGRSRGMHRSQGFGGGGGGGKGGGGGPAPQSFSLLRGDPAKSDIFEGVETTWKRYNGGAEIARLSDKAVADFSTKNPAASVPTLLELRKLVAAVPGDPLVNDKRRQLDRILLACLGLEVETAVDSAEVVPGETLKLRHVANLRGDVPVRWVGVRYPSIKTELKDSVDLRPSQPSTRVSAQTLPANSPLSQPYWLRQDGTVGMFRVDEASLIGQPENPPAFPVEHVFEVGGQQVVVPDEPMQAMHSATKTNSRRRLEVIAPVSISHAFDVKLFAPGATRAVEVEVAALRPSVDGVLHLEGGEGWKIEPATQPFRLEAVGAKARLGFKVTAPNKAAIAQLTARARIGGATYSSGRVEIRYDHIPPQLLQPTAKLKVVGVDLAIRGKKVGYVPGAGDSVAESIEQMGYEVTKLTGADLVREKLGQFDAVVIGVRAFNVRNDLGPRMAALFDYVKDGGNVIVQYNRPNPLQVNKIAPYDLRISSDRVTVEEAPMTFLAPDHPALNTPNKITAADFEGWVQERGLYFPNQWDKQFIPLLACNDPGYQSTKGSLLVAQHGKGYFVYTGLAWFRQLPDGVPGAYRLFANLVSLGKK